MKSVQRLIPFVKPYWKAGLLALLMLAAASLMELAIPMLVQRVIDEGIAHQDTTVVLNTTLTMLVAAGIGAFLIVGNSILAVRVAQNFSADLRSALFRKVQTLSFGNLDQLRTGKLMTRLTSDVTQVQTVVLMSLRILTRAPVMLVTSLILLFRTAPQLAPIMLVLIPVMTALMWFFVTKSRPLFLSVQQKLDRLNNVLQENLAGVRVVKAFVRANHENARFDQSNTAYMKDNLRVMQLLSALIPSLFLIINLGVVAAVWFGGLQVNVGSLTTGAVIAFVNYLFTTMMPLLMLAMMVGILSAGEASAGRIQEVLDSHPQVQNLPDAQAVANIGGRIAFDDVCFSYAGNCNEPVLTNINLVAEPGETVAILGATGAGKSSLVHLIPRFYDVTTGQITIDGTDVRAMTLDSLRSRIGVALQETVLFSGTVRDNIRYGRANATDEEVVTAAKAAQAHEFIMGFEEGYETHVGQRGVNLSGGQKQRIAIARALLIQPRILILDDSTSSVDVDTEAKIETALEELLKDRSSFVIAQRVSTVLNADKIVVLDRGRIAALGTHSELMESSPIYQEIYQSQLGNGGTQNG
ncbi:MAG: ABC transporter ATP-binding protein/permease [Anaerolineae bacterium]|nr:ABC transporter ATP-binding protein/permease [Anaerolineae bacterium]